MIKKLLIVQPWFTAIGHPAQSLVNTANILGKNDHISYLVSREFKKSEFTKLADELRDYGQVRTFAVPASSPRLCTLLGLLSLISSARGYNRVFFLDAHLVLVALFWPLIACFLSLEKLSVTYLMGPEKISGNWFARRVFSAFISRKDTQVFLRTEELVEAWEKTFPGERFDVLPSLEIPSFVNTPTPPVQAEKLRYGVIGQVRPGKGLEWLVPLFDAYPEIGELTVAGTFFSRRHENALSVLNQRRNFINRYLPEEELVRVAANQHYLLMLYDDWDDRMEAATLYLAARANRPVLVRDAGWCGRMIKKYSCGLICRKGDETIDFFLSLPKPTDPAYLSFLLGIEKFRSDHSGQAWRKQFIEQIFSD